eukprot:gnl/TRDRNA2_/TRDRNA2_163067_c1_seq1.p1 gnl/TRDRNA2_/TRDRNA2_163067_c1~~gnl/TRDRNA2_/TRDRNA2_163067_c1_seq1.p1  ORF type:complete len:804 (+),score=160.53 gnl/TRDRNA2_/TRDRNA2_163067_c1_seq1:362-2413(+)
MTPENMNVGFIEPNPNFGTQEVNILPHYNVSFVVQEFDKKFPGRAKQWSEWLTGKDKSASDTALKASLNKANITSTAALQLAIVPKPIEGVPKEISRQHMHAETMLTAEQVDTQLEVSMYGQRPSVIALPSPKTPAPHNLDDRAKVWYRSGWMTNSPKVTMSIELRPPRPQDDWETSAEDSLRLRFYSALLSEEMDPKLTDLIMTGSTYSIGVSTKGVHFTFTGFAPVIPLLIDKVLSEVNKGVNVEDPARYDRLTTQYNESFHKYSDMPISYAVSDMHMLLTPGSHSREDMIDALDKMTKEKAAKSTEDLLFTSPFELTALVMGNVDEVEAKSAVAKIRDGLLVPKGVTVGPAQGQVQHIEPIVKPSQPIEVRKQNPRPGDPNDAVVVSLIAGVADIQSRVLMGLLGQILHPVAYNKLRTDMQLGYVVQGGAGKLSNVQYLNVMVQGLVLNADETEAAIEGVYSSLMPKRLHELTEAEFKSFKDSFVEDLLQKPSGHSDEFGHFHSPVAMGGVCFTLRDEMLEYLKSLSTKQPLIDAYNSIVFPKNGQRRKLVVKYFAGGAVPAKPTPSESLALMKKYNVSDEGIRIISREKDNTMYLDKVDASTRKKIVDKDGYFPQELLCELKRPTSQPAAVVANKTSVLQVEADVNPEDVAHVALLESEVRPHRRLAGNAAFLAPHREN